MQFRQLMKTHCESIYGLSCATGLSQPLIGALSDGRLHPGKLQAQDLYRIAVHLSVPMEDFFKVTADSSPLSPPSGSEYRSFLSFRREELYRLEEEGDLDFVLSTVSIGRIKQLWETGNLSQTLYLLALCDHVLADHFLPLLEVFPMPRTHLFSPCLHLLPGITEAASLPAFRYFGIAETASSLKTKDL